MNILITVGQNALPPFIAALQALNQQDSDNRIFLIHSGHDAQNKGTEKFAKKIECIIKKIYLNKSITIKLIDLQGNHSNVSHIENFIEQETTEITIHEVHVTGGTREMGVAAECFAVKKQARVTYLDPDKGFMEANSGTGILNKSCINGTLAKKVLLEHICELNNIKFYCKTYNYNSGGAEGFCNLDKAIRIDICKHLDINNLSLQVISDLVCCYSTENNKPKQAWLAKITSDNKVVVYQTNPKILNTNIVDDKEFENYVSLISQNILKGDVYEHFSNVIMRFEYKIHHRFCKSNSQHHTDFEIDHLVRYGTELCAISATTGVDFLEAKAYEVWLRSRQMGGDFARAILVLKNGNGENPKVKELKKQFKTTELQIIELAGTNSTLAGDKCKLKAAFEDLTFLV